MRSTLLLATVITQAFFPSAVAFAAETSTAAAPADIFVSEPQPEFTLKHAQTEPWSGHGKYHTTIQQRIRAWEEDFTTRQVTPPYTQEKRTFLRYLQREHRKAHFAKEAPVVVQATGQGQTAPLPAPEAPSGVRPTGRAALFTPLPKMSQRLLEKRQIQIFGNRN